MKITDLDRSLKAVCWMVELVTNGPDAKPINVLGMLSLITDITNQWPVWYREIVVGILEETR